MRNMRQAFLLMLLASNLLNAMETSPKKEASLQQKFYNLMAQHNLKIAAPVFGQRPNILKKGEKHQGERGCIYYTYDKNLSETLKDLENEGKVELDNGLFVQVANIIKNGQENEPLTFFQGWCPSLINALHDENRAYIAPCDVWTGMYLQAGQLNSKGQWVIRDEENWLGLNRDSTIISQSKNDWLESMPVNLKSECEEIKNMGGANLGLNTSCEFANIYFKRGKLDAWCMFEDK